MAAFGVVAPQADPRQREEVHRVGDHIGEQRLEIDLAADLRGETAKGIGPCLRIADHPDPVAVGPAAGEPGIEIGLPDERLVARADDRRQATAQAPGPGCAARDSRGGGDIADAQQRIVTGWLEREGHLGGR